MRKIKLLSHFGVVHVLLTLFNLIAIWIMVLLKVLRKLCIKKCISVSTYCWFKRLKAGETKKTYSRRPFLLNSLSHNECEKLFRFSKSELYRIKSALGIPDNCTASHGEAVSGTKTLFA